MPAASCFGMVHRLLASLLIIAACLPGCRSRPAVADRPDTYELERYQLFRSDGQIVGWASLVEDAIGADVVLIGEEHDNAHGQALAARLWEQILERTDSAALSLEFLERDQQTQLDDYLAGIVGPENDYSRMAKYPEGHVRMIDAAKAAGRPVIASNAPRRYIRIASRQGYEALLALPPDRQTLFAIPAELPSGPYRERFMELMSSGMHGGQPGASPEDVMRQAENGFRSQSLWDSTMADSIVRALATGHRPVVQVIGRFHTDHDGGTVQMLRLARPNARVVVMSVVNRDASTLHPEDAGAADYILYAPN